MENPLKKKSKPNEEDITNHFDNFVMEKVLLNDTKSKTVHVLGRFSGCDDNAVVTLVKPPFSQDLVAKILASDSSTTNKEFENDIYSQYTVYPKPVNNAINSRIIFPATEKHILKYTHQKLHTLVETANEYENVTLPYLQKNPLKLEWVYNILEHKAEVDRIIYEDPDKENGFILLPDLKWDAKQMENLYVCAICHNRDVKSIRDLNEKHLPLLKNLLNKGVEEIVLKYGVEKDELRVYFHYYPTYYHLHVHYNHLRADLGGTSAGKAHLVSDVIDNIENIASDFYQRKRLPVILRDNDPLYVLLAEEKAKTTGDLQA